MPKTFLRAELCCSSINKLSTPHTYTTTRTTTALRNPHQTPPTSIPALQDAGPRRARLGARIRFHRSPITLGLRFRRVRQHQISRKKMHTNISPTTVPTMPSADSQKKKAPSAKPANAASHVVAPPHPQRKKTRPNSTTSASSTTFSTEQKRNKKTRIH